MWKTLIFLLFFASLAAEEPDFGVKFAIGENRSLEAFRKSVNGNAPLELSLRIGHASENQLSKLDNNGLQESIRSDLLFDKVLNLMKFKFSHFALFGKSLVAVYQPVNALTGQPDRESQRAVQEIVSRVRKDFKKAFDKGSEITWKTTYSPYIQELGSVEGETPISIDYRGPIFFVLMKQNAGTNDLRKLIEIQKTLLRSPEAVKARADDAEIFVVPYE